LSHPNEPEMVALRVPPHSNESEQSLLGALLIDNNALDRVADVVSGDDFYRDEHRRIWRHISRLIESGKAADVVTVHESIEASEDKGKTGGAAYLAGLSMNTPSSLNIRRYAEIVRGRSIQRRIAQVGTEVAEAALGPQTIEPDQLLDEAENKIFAISATLVARGDGPQPIQGLLVKVYERIDHLHSQDNPSGITGVPTGFTELDQRTAGMQPGDLIVVAGRPSMGKTAFALNVAEQVALPCALPVVIFSMEMSGQSLSQRMLSSLARVDAHKLRTGRLNDEEWSTLTEGMERMQAAKIHIDESAALTALEVRARARRLKREYSKLGLVIVDYLQLMATKGKENRATEVGDISRAMKQLAKELDCPVMLLSQLNRDVEKRHDRRPMMQDLRESGAIEQDADVILFLYREEVYRPDDEEAKGRAEVIIGKQRNGPIGRVDLTYLGRFTRFMNAAWEHGQPRVPKRAPRVFDFKSKAAGEDAA
jgi:replicative DNA helicase